MPAAKVLAIFDTTALHKDWTMAGTRWGQVWALSKRGFLEVAVPHVVVMEAARQLIEHLDAQEKKLVGVADEVELLLRRLRNVGVHRLGWTHVRDQEPSLPRTGVEDAIYRRIKDMRGEVLPLPTVDHRSVVDRDLDRRKPFQPTGKGYRDALAWLSAVERMKDCPDGQRVVLITDNTSDYVEAGGLASDLLREVPAHVQESGITILKDVSSLLQSQEVTDLLAAVLDSNDELASEYKWEAVSALPDVEHLSAENALTHAAGRLVGATVSLGRGRSHDPGGLDFDKVELDADQEFWEVEVGYVKPHAETGRWRVYDVHADETVLIEAEMEADVGFVGGMDAEYYYFGTPPGYTRLEDSPGGRVVRVSSEKRVLLHFKAIADRSTRTVQAIDFDYATRVGVGAAPPQL